MMYIKHSIKRKMIDDFGDPIDEKKYYVIIEGIIYFVYIEWHQFNEVPSHHDQYFITKSSIAPAEKEKYIKEHMEYLPFYLSKNLTRDILNNLTE